MNKWKPETFEDKLILSYFKENGGTIYTEVPTPWSGGEKDWPKGYTNRYIDAVRIPNTEKENKIKPFADHGEEFLKSVEGKIIELIEVKERLNRYLIGQLLAGHDLFKADYSPKKIKLVALCQTSEPGLEWVCKNRKIKIEILNPF